MKYLIVRLILIFVFVIPYQSFAESDWDNIDKKLFIGLTSTYIIDCLQTKYIFDHSKEYQESNLIIRSGVKQHGKIFIPCYFATAIGGSFLIANELSPLLRKFTLSLLLFSSIYTINNNFMIGIGFAF